jgi:hypothetical protein
MTADNLLNHLTEGTILDGPHWTEPVKILTAKARGSRIRLAAEAHRIRLAFQYDPHFAVSVSQIDPLPHQLSGLSQKFLNVCWISGI